MSGHLCTVLRVLKVLGLEVPHGHWPRQQFACSLKLAPHKLVKLVQYGTVELSRT